MQGIAAAFNLLVWFELSLSVLLQDRIFRIHP